MAQETPENDGVYYMYNDASDLFLTRGEEWGTQAVAKPVGLPWKISIAADGKYTLRMYDLTIAGSTSGFGGNCFTDNDSPIQFTPSGSATDGFTLQNGDNFITCPNSAGGVSLSVTTSTWKFLTQAQYDAVLAARVTAQEAAIASAKGITIPSGQTLNDVVTDVDNWAASATVNDGVPTSSTWTPSKYSDRGGNTNWGDYGTEMYQCGNAHYTRTITGLKQGIYKVAVRGMKRMANNANCVIMGDAGYPISDTYLSANGNIIRIKAWYENRAGAENPNSTGDFVNIVNAGGYIAEGFVYVGSDGKLELDASSEAYWGGVWFLFNGISYTYYDNSVSEEDATEILSQATTLEDKYMLGTIKSALTNAKTTFDGAHTIANYNALSSAIEAANLSIAAYAPLGDKLTEAASVKTAVSSNSPSYVNTFDTNIATITTNYNEGNIAEADIATQIGNVETEIRNLVKSQTVEGSDMSRAIPNAAGNAAVNNDNWKIENALAEGEKFQLDTWAGSASGMSVPMIEYWIAKGNTLSGNTIYQTISGLAAGTYTVTATIAVNNESTVAPNAGSALLFGNDKTKDITTGGTVTSFSGNTGTFSVSVTLSEGQDLKIGLKTVEPNYNWIAFKDFKLIKGEIKPKSISLDKTSANLMAGETTTIIATVDEDASNKTVIWTSSNEKVATVANGLISAVGAGSATITAKCEAAENINATASVSVTNAAAPAYYSELAEGDFYIRNVGTGKFLDGGNDYGTRASVSKRGIPVKLSKVADKEGVYTIDTYMFRDANNHFLRGDYCDQGATEIHIKEVSSGSKVYTLSTESNSKFIALQAGTTIVENNAANGEVSLAQWQFVSRDDLKKGIGTPTTDNPADLTFYLNDANNTTHYAMSWDGGQKLAWNGEYSRGGTGSTDPFTVAERYHATTNVYQTVAVPNGTYKVRVQGFYRNDDGATDISYLYANNQQTELKVFNADGQGTTDNKNGASLAFSKDQYWNEVTVTVENNQLTVGIKTDGEHNWTCWDNFELWLTTANGLNVQPAIANGDYYLYNNGKYMTRRGVSGGERNEGVVRTEGELLANVMTDNAGITLISFYDKADGTDAVGTHPNLIKERLFLSKEQVYTDGKRHVEKNYHHHYWAINKVSGGYTLRNIEDGRYLAVKEDGETVTVVSDEDDAAVWTFDTQSSASALYSSATAAEGSFNPGFENGEHAPYNNVAKLSAIAQVKALGSEGQYPSLKIASLANAISSDWVVNSGEVNAIYDGTFNNAPVNPATGGVNGWSAAEGLRQLVKSDVEGSIVSTGMYVWGKNVMTYGETTGYTLPLKANTVYKLTYDRASWEGESSTHSDVTIKDPNGNVLGTASEKGSAGYWKSTDGTLISQTVYFVTTNAGNYTLLMCPWGNTVFTNMELKKTNDVLTFADGSVPSYLPGTYPSVKIDREFSSDKWSTAVYPFAVSADKIAVLKSYDAESGKLAFESASASTPNVPFLLKNDGAITTLSNVEVSPAVAEDAYDADSIVSLKGVYAQTSVEAEEGVTNYVLSNNKIYKVGANAATVNPYHAYIKLALPTLESRELTFTVDGEATGISEVKAQNNAADGNIYNLNGQRVKNAKKGVYIMNGKTVIVK